MSFEGAALSSYVGFLHYLGNYISSTGGVPVTTAKCPECGGTWSVWKTLCPASQDFECGYRSMWKCENPDCGEIELR